MSEHIFKNTKNIKLSQKEKESARTALRAFIAMNPIESSVRNGEYSRHINQKEQRSIFLQIYKTMPIALIIALIMGGGAAAAAEVSLPGDALYPVKVNVNEEVRGWLAVSNEAEAKLQVDLASRRLEEAEKLAKENRLDADVRAKIEANFDDHAARVATRVEAMEDDSRGNTNAVEVTSRFEASLRAHEEILKRLAEEKGDDNSVSSIVDRVRSVSDSVDRVRADAEAGISSDDGSDDHNVDRKTAAERAGRRAEQKIKDVKALLNKPTATVAPDAEVREKIALAEKLLESGREYMKLEAYGKAFVTFQESWNVAQKAWIVMNGSAAVQISLGSATDPAVPPQVGIAPTPGAVTPSSEIERQRMEAVKRYEQALSKISEVRRFLSVRMGVMTEETGKKVEAQLVAADKALGEAKQYLSVQAYAKSIVMSRQAKEYAEIALRIAVGEDPSVPPTSGLVPVQKISPSGEIEIELEDEDGSGKFR